MIMGTITWTSTVEDDNEFPNVVVTTTVDYVSTSEEPPEFYDVRAYRDDTLIGQARMSSTSGGAQMMGQIMQQLIEITQAAVGNHKGAKKYSIPGDDGGSPGPDRMAN